LAADILNLRQPNGSKLLTTDPSFFDPSEIGEVETVSQPIEGDNRRDKKEDSVK